MQWNAEYNVGHQKRNELKQNYNTTTKSVRSSINNILLVDSHIYSKKPAFLLINCIINVKNTGTFKLLYYCLFFFPQHSLPSFTYFCNGHHNKTGSIYVLPIFMVRTTNRNLIWTINRQTSLSNSNLCFCWWRTIIAAQIGENVRIVVTRYLSFIIIIISIVEWTRTSRLWWCCCCWASSRRYCRTDCVMQIDKNAARIFRRSMWNKMMMAAIGNSFYGAPECEEPLRWRWLKFCVFSYEPTIIADFKKISIYIVCWN